MLLLSALTTNSFLQPKTPDDFKRYLVGDWKLRKRITYKEGGVSGMFDGEASFKVLDAKSPSYWGLVAYSESGTFSPEQSATFPPMETRNRLLYDFSSAMRAEVYFDTLDDASRTSTEAIFSAASKLYDLEPPVGPDAPLGVLGISQAQVEGQTYSGQIEVEAPNAFISTWRVVGNGQNGEIASLYTRVTDESDGVIDV